MAIIQNLEAFVQSYPAGLDSVTDLQLSQNENGRQIRFTIGGVTIPAGSVATISGTKPDGVVYSNTGTIEGADTVIFDEDVQMTAVFGTWYAKIRITNAGNTIASARVRFIIDKDPVDAGAIPSESQLDGLVAEAEEYAEAAGDAAERAAITYGSPLTASTAAAMTDVNRVYVYTGSESGYTYGNWYYYNGSAWVSGGVYNSAAVETDTTLTESGVPADAKATGDKIAELKDDLSDVNVIIRGAFTTGFESGAYGSAGNNKVSYTSRIRNSKPIYVGTYYSITIPRGYEAILIYLDADLTKIDATASYVRGEQLIADFESGTVYINLNIRNISTPDADISSEVDTVKSGVKVTSIDKEFSDEISSNIIRLEGLDGNVVIDSSDFDIGAISISNTGWTYSSNNKRIRTKQGVTIALNAGSVIGLTNYTNARFYLGALLPDGTYWSKGWITSDFAVPYDGEYVLTASNLTEVALNDKSDLLDLLFIHKSNNTADIAKYLNNNLYVKMPMLFEVGNINISTSGWTYVYDVKRARTPLGTAVHLYKGDRITLSDYSAYRFYLGWRKADGTYSYKGWVTENYDVQEDGDYVVLIATVSGTAPASMKVMMDSCSIYHRYGASDIIKNNASSYCEPIVKGINHRGYNLVAPENTLPAFELSKAHGFRYVETDIAFTNDDVAVLLHDGTINRTARNADGTEIIDDINIYDITYAQALTYVFCSDKYISYPTVKIPTLEQFIKMCKLNELHPYIELKTDGGYTQAQVANAVNIVKSQGMKDHVTWISFSNTYLGYVKTEYPKARLGYLCGELTESVISTASALINDVNNVFIDASTVTSETIALAVAAGIPVEIWTLNTVEQFEALNPYITGVTSDELIADVVLKSLT